MKFLAVIMMFALGVSTLCGAAYFRSDANGNDKSGKVIIKALPGELNAGVFTWVKEEDRDATITFSAKNRVTSEAWSTFQYGFTAENTGKVTVSFGAQWTKDPEKREWVYIDSIKLNGELIPNGDFAKTYKKGEKWLLEVFWIHPKAEIVEGAGLEGSKAIRVNHDARISQVFDVEAGKTYTFTVTVKAAPAPEAPAGK